MCVVVATTPAAQGQCEVAEVAVFYIFVWILPAEAEQLRIVSSACKRIEPPKRFD